MLLHVTEFSSFLSLNTIHCVYRLQLCLSIHLSWIIWTVTTFWLFCIMLLWSLSYPIDKKKKKQTSLTLIFSSKRLRTGLQTLLGYTVLFCFLGIYCYMLRTSIVKLSIISNSGLERAHEIFCSPPLLHLVLYRLHMGLRLSWGTCSLTPVTPLSHSRRVAPVPQIVPCSLRS